jgi:hypothetical protein
LSERPIETSLSRIFRDAVEAAALQGRSPDRFCFRLAIPAPPSSLFARSRLELASDRTRCARLRRRRDVPDPKVECASWWELEAGLASICSSATSTARKRPPAAAANLRGDPHTGTLSTRCPRLERRALLSRSAFEGIP